MPENNNAKYFVIVNPYFTEDDEKKRILQALNEDAVAKLVSDDTIAVTYVGGDLGQNIIDILTSQGIIAAL